MSIKDIKAEIQQRAIEEFEKNPDYSARQVAKIIYPEFQEERSWRTIYDLCKPSNLANHSLMDVSEEMLEQQWAIQEEEKSHIWDEDLNAYRVFSPYRVKPIIVPLDTHKAILEAYSNYGEGVTIIELSERFGFEHAEMIWYLRAFNIVHGKLPFTDEEVDDSRFDKEVEDSLVRHGIALQRGKLARKIQKARWRDTLKYAEIGRAFEEQAALIAQEVADALSKAEVYWPEYKNLETDFDSSSFIDVIPVYDRHISKIGYNEEEEPTTLVDMVAGLMTSRRGSECYFVIGGDYFNEDTAGDTTTRGTKQHSTRRKGMARGFGEFFRAVKYLSTMYEMVHCVIIPGNHDERTSVALNLAMHEALMWLDAEGVDIPVRLVQDQFMGQIAGDLIVEEYGSNLLAFEHGDGPKPNKLMEVLATGKYRKAWGRTDRTLCWTGHLHHALEHAVFGGMVNQQPQSHKITDTWHKKQGYTSVEPAIRRYMVHHKFGITQTFEAKLSLILADF